MAGNNNHLRQLCRTQAKVIPNYANPNVHGTGQAETVHRNYKRFKLGGSQAYDRLINCSFRAVI
jgi:hypothetical protein